MEQLFRSRVRLLAGSLRQQSTRKRRQVEDRVFIAELDLGKAD